MLTRDAKETDLPEIIEIYNSTIACRTVTGDTEPVTVESRLAWFHSHSPDHFPLWVTEVDDRIAGWIGFQHFYGRPAYDVTAEISLYVAAPYRRCGIGRRLLSRAIAASPQLGLTTLLGFIFADNKPSLLLFEQFGFQHWGYLPGVARFHPVDRDLVILGLKVKP